MTGLLFELADELNEQFYNESSKYPSSIKLFFRTLDFYKRKPILLTEIVAFKSRISLKSLRRKSLA